jgi:hypothetical protein
VNSSELASVGFLELSAMVVESEALRMVAAIVSLYFMYSKIS